MIKPELNDQSNWLPLNGGETTVNRLWPEHLSSPAACEFEMGIDRMFDHHVASHLTGNLKNDNRYAQ
ncbi:MAG: hypothetical protein R6U40_08865 [Desulfobacterales bacterium]